MSRIRDFFSRKNQGSYDAGITDYTGAVQDYLYSEALEGGVHEHLAPVSAAVQYIESAFLAGASVEPEGVIEVRDLVPHIRRLVIDGSSVALFEMRGDAPGGYTLIPASSYHVYGETPDERGWSYRVELSGPSGSSEVRRPAKTVLHFRSAPDLRSPDIGKSAVRRARSTMAAAHQSEKAAWGDMRGLNVRAVISTDPSMSAIRGMQRDEITKTLSESFRGAVNQGKVPVLPPGFMFTTTPAASGPRQGLDSIRDSLQIDQAALCGVPAPLLGYGNPAASSLREYYRQFAAVQLAAIGKVFSSELSRKLKTEMTLTFGRLFAGDLAGKARAYKALTEAGFPADQAEELLGLD